MVNKNRSKFSTQFRGKGAYSRGLIGGLTISVRSIIAFEISRIKEQRVAKWHKQFLSANSRGNYWTLFSAPLIAFGIYRTKEQREFRKSLGTRMQRHAHESEDESHLRTNRNFGRIVHTTSVSRRDVTYIAKSA